MKVISSNCKGVIRRAIASGRAGGKALISFGMIGCVVTFCSAQNPPSFESSKASHDRTESSKGDASPGHPHLRQPPDPGFWSVMREVQAQSFSSRIDFMMLLSHPTIRAEVGLTEEEFQQLVEFNVGLFRGIKAIHQAQAEDPLPRDQLVAKVIELLAEHDQQFVEYLHSQIDFDRFINILVQARGNRSVVHAEIAQRIELSPERLAELRAISHRVWREQMDEMGDHIRELIRRGEMKDLVRHGQNEEVRQLFQKAEQKVNESVGRRLTSEQLTALEQLRGESFELPSDLFEIRFPPGPGRHGMRGADDHRDRRRPRSE